MQRGSIKKILSTKIKNAIGSKPKIKLRYLGEKMIKGSFIVEDEEKIARFIELELTRDFGGVKMMEYVGFNLFYW